MFARKSKRHLALLLAVLMVVGLLPISALAAGSEAQIKKNGVNPVYHTLDHASGSVTAEGVQAPVSTTGGKVEIEKTIAGTGTENVFDITLKVKTKQQVSTTVTSPDAAAVLVIDASSSMDDGTRLPAAKAAAIEFARSFAADANGAKRYIALVQFHQGSTILLGWVDAAALTWAATPDNAITRAITAITTAAYTNPEAGLQLAYNLMKTSTVSGVAAANKFVVLLTDGSPNAYIKTSINTTTRNNATSFSNSDVTTDYNSSYGSKTAADKAKTVAQNITGTGTNQLGIKLYSVCYGASSEVIGTGGSRQSVSAWLTSISTRCFTADNSSQLNQSFESIIEQIRLITQAWTVVDPMGQFIVFDQTHNASAPRNIAVNSAGSLRNFNTSNKTLYWNLKGETFTQSGPTSNRLYTYTLTYRVSLDTAAQGFSEAAGQYYLTNGVTSLSYAFYNGEGKLLDESGKLIYNADGTINTASDRITTLRTLDFKVPAVKGTVPTVPYTIEFYKKDKATGAYPTQPTNTLNGTGKLWSTVSVSAVEPGYATKYTNYAAPTGDTSKVLASTTANVLKLYYDPIQAQVTVNHYLTTTTVSDTGATTTGPALAGTDTPAGPFYQGDSYTADLLGSYTFDSAASDNRTITLVGGANTINLYYTTTAEARTPVDYTIDYWYRTNSWELVDGKYQLTDGTYVKSTQPGVSISASAFHGTPVTAPQTDDKTDGGAYTLDSANTTATTMTLDKNGTNHLDIYLQKDAAAPETATLQITHVYNEIQVSGTVTLGTVSNDPQTVYVGETWTATPVASYEDYTDFSVTTDEADLTKTIAAGENTIEIVYTRDARVETSVTVNHYFYAYSWTIDENGDAVLTEPESYTDTETEQLAGTYYVGGSATASAWSLQGKYSGYSARLGNEYELDGLDAQENVISLFYDKIPANDLGEADVTVKHVYNTYTTYIDAAGNTISNELSTVGKSEEKVAGYVGEWFMASPDFTDADGESEGYTQVAPSPEGTQAVKVTLSASGGEFIFTYARYIDLRVETSVTIQPVYVTYSRYIDENGETQIKETGRETPNAWSSESNGLTVYEGQKFTASTKDFKKKGFTFDANHEETTQYQNVLLAGSEQPTEIVLVYTKVTDDRELATVVIRNHYTFKTFLIKDNKFTTVTLPDNLVLPVPVLKLFYGNQFFSTEGKGAGGKYYSQVEPFPAEQIQLKPGVNYVDFYYYGEKDLTQPATILVVHHYKETDTYTGNVNISKKIVEENGHYATQTYVASALYPDLFTSDSITSVTPETALEEEVGITLNPGENRVDIQYERTYDSRVGTTVEVLHQYVSHDTFTNKDQDDGSYKETISAKDAEGNWSIWVGGSYTAKTIEKHYVGSTEYVYAVSGVSGADPETYIRTELSAETNTITITYLRSFDSREGTPYSYTVRYVNGSTGQVIDTATATAPYGTTLSDGLVSEGLGSGWINAKRPGGYNAGSVGGYITISENAADNVITVTYTYTYTDSGDDDDYVPPVVTPPTKETEIPEEQPPLSELPEEAEIPEETVPLAPVPEITEMEIVEDEVPLGNLPQTGTMAEPVRPMWTLGMLALSFSMAAVGLTVTFGRKRDEEEK